MVNVPVYTPGPLGLRGEYLPPNSRPVSETAYTANASDSGRVIVSNSSATFTLTIPVNLPSGFNCGWSQRGAGTLTLAAGAGVTMNQRQSHTGSAGQFANGNILNVDLNEYDWGGDTA